MAQIRANLRLTQNDFAAILCVTQATVARWESKDATTSPTGDAARRLQQLQAMLRSPEQKKILKEALRSMGGVGAVAALLSLGTTSSGITLGAPLAGTLLGSLGIAGTLSARVLYRTLGEVLNHKRSTKEKQK